jgi:hypothetical protein
MSPEYTNPSSPFRFVKTERYAPGGGTNLLGVVGEEHALLETVQSMRETAKRAEPIAESFVAHTRGWCVWVSMMFS